MILHVYIWRYFCTRLLQSMSHAEPFFFWTGQSAVTFTDLGTKVGGRPASRAPSGSKHRRAAEVDAETIHRYW